MTSEEFTNRLPVFANDPLPIKPPFAFKGLSARVFPLRANLDALQQLCNGYLNFVPPEVGRFRAVVPYVYLSILNYGQISEVVTALGWFAQVEVFFCVPVEWYKVVNGKWVFYDWAVITPFIYVDDDISVPTGRGVYGFPKALAKITPSKSQWMTDPVAPIFRLHTRKTSPAAMPRFASFLPAVIGAYQVRPSVSVYFICVKGL